MADKAQSEPTMEEILASIRKIIADDGDTTQSSAQASTKSAAAVSVNMTDDDDFDDLSLDDVVGEGETEGDQSVGSGSASDDDFSDNFSDDFRGEVGDDMFDDVSEDEGASASGLETDMTGTPSDVLPQPSSDDFEDFDFDALDLDKDEPAELSASVEETLEEISPEWDAGTEEIAETEADTDLDFMLDDQPEPKPESDFAAPPEPETARIETPMTREPTETTHVESAASHGLTDERIAGAAASALGKLMVNKSAEDETNPNTLDGLMRELLRPMIKEWLDANLPAIVERKVEEEVQRIARMAR